MTEQEAYQNKGNNLYKAVNSIIKYTESGHKRKIAGLIVLVFISAILDVVGLAAVLPLIKAGTDLSIIHSNYYLNTLFTYFGFINEKMFVLFLIAILVAYFLFKTAFGIFVNWLQKRLTSEIAIYVTETQFRKYFLLDYLDFNGIKSSVLIRNILYNPISYVQWMITPLTTILSESFIVILVIGAIAWYDLFLFGFILVTIGPATYIVYRTLRNKGSKIGLGIDKVFPYALGTLNESIIGYVDIKLAAKTDQYRIRYIRHLKNYMELLQSANLISTIPQRTNEVIALFSIVLIFLYAFFISTRDSDLIVLVGAFAAAAYRLLPSMNRMMNAFTYINNNQVSIYNLGLYEDCMKNEGSDTSTGKVVFNQSIALDKITFRFPQTDKSILSDLSFEVKKGEKVGFVGASGSGKTTLMNILLRLYKENSGCITVDGQPLMNNQTDAWRQMIGYVKQDIFLIDGSIRDNITLGDPNPDIERLKLVIKQASLEQLVNSLPSGIDSQIGEKGNQLSGGQRQRIGIARSLYRNAEILIFDEATSALDTATEQEVSESIDSLSAINKTVFIIAHRVTTLKNCDRIYELKDGKVDGIYSYKDLLSKIV